MHATAAPAARLVTLALLAVLGADAAAMHGLSGPRATAAAEVTGPALPGRVTVRPGRPGRAVAAPPVEVLIPKLKLRNRLVGLRVGTNGALGTPTDYDRAGWWREGPAPGDQGAAVIVGHVDSREGPAVFFELGTLRKGDPVSVRRADGTTVTFRVDAVRTYDKRRFPTSEVYGPTKGPQLRLITCGGTFDRRSRHYRDNVVVFASLVRPASAKPPAAPKAAKPAKPTSHSTGRTAR